MFTSGRCPRSRDCRETTLGDTVSSARRCKFQRKLSRKEQPHSLVWGPKTIGPTFGPLFSLSRLHFSQEAAEQQRQTGGGVCLFSLSAGHKSKQSGRAALNGLNTRDSLSFGGGVAKFQPLGVCLWPVLGVQPNATACLGSRWSR